jgi:hypothetical protein
VSKVANTLARAIRLIAILDSIPPAIHAAESDLDEMDEQAWRGLASADNGRPISADTRIAMRSILAARKTAVA